MARGVGSVVALAVLLSAARAAEPEYLVGGPLAGRKLPLFATQHGEPAGYPGSIPELAAKGEVVNDMGNAYREWGPQGQGPEMQLTPDSVEHWRAYMFKYMPIRSMFDVQSQVRNFVAPGLPGAARSQVEQYAAPVYWVPRHADRRPTGRFMKPVPVVRMRVDAPVLKLDFGELPVGLYAVRVIGAVETKALRPFRQPLFLRMQVNDGADGGTSHYRIRLPYCDEFYSVGEVHFHAPVRRRYAAELAVDRGSKVDLLVHNVCLDDALAGTERRALKTRTTTAEPLAPAAPPDLDRGKRLSRDAGIWRAFPPINAQGSGIAPGHGGYGSIRGVSAGSDALDGKAIIEQHGPWVAWGRHTREMVLPEGTTPHDVFLANPKLGLLYTVADLRAGRPLPDPYPLKDDGAGLFFPDPADPAKGRVWSPIGLRVHRVYGEYYRGIGRSIQLGEKSGGYDDIHDAALTLARYAYAFPSLDYSRYLSNAAHEVGPFGRDYACRRRGTAANFLPHYMIYVKPIMFHYDRLFEFIRGNRLLAESVGRFVPWVKTPEDVVKLIDVYLVQTTAKRILRYHYHTDPMDIANLAAVVGDTKVTDPWMEWLFTRTFIYPLPVAGIQDTMISGTTREGTEFVGSTYYAQGEGASRIAAALDGYRAAGGNPRYDLSDPARYPKPIAHAFWCIENVVAGWDFMRIGDVCGPDKVPGHTLRGLGFARSGWGWTRDPRFAFILKHYLKRGTMDEKAWAAVEQAAARCPRAPWLENRSRVLPMWAGVLETGLEHDDPRFRRSVTLRVGYGLGHHHDDTLDLQVAAHGLPMTVDGGQRPGYSSPADRTSRIHNTVEVGGHSHREHSWITALADHRGARYQAASAVPPPEATLFRRQVALVDVDEGRGSQKLPPEQQKPGALLPKGVVTPNSYVFDVFRVAGGSRHMYCFHGPLHDDFQWNAQGAAPPKPGSPAAEYLRMFKVKPELNAAGKAPALFQATWRMVIDVPGPGGGEKEMLGRNYEPDAPRKFTRLHLLGVRAADAMRGQFVCRKWGYDYTNVMVGRAIGEGDRPASVFPAVIEPYVGKPFITSVGLLAVGKPSPVPGDAVAVEVKTANGHTDVCFADARPDQTRTILEAGMNVAGEFAYLSTDGEGLRQATLVGGTLLATPHVRIEAAEAGREARVVKVDYLKKTLWLDKAWPERAKPLAFEIGLAEGGHMTTYTATQVGHVQGGSVVALQRGADAYRSEVLEAAADGTVTCTLKPLSQYVRGNRKGWVASDDQASRFWRADHIDMGTFKLSGGAVSREAFGKAGVLRLWEYGVGDTARHRTSVSLRRVAPGRFELEADVAVKLSLRAQSLHLSADGETWQALAGERKGEWLTASIPLARRAGARRLLRLEP